LCRVFSGELTFDAKALNCEQGNGVAAIIYNNENGSYTGTLTDESTVTIPVVAVTKEIGETILNDYLGSVGNLIVKTNYAFADGTRYERVYEEAGLVTFDWIETVTTVYCLLPNSPVTLAHLLNPAWRHRTLRAQLLPLGGRARHSAATYRSSSASRRRQKIWATMARTSIMGTV